MTVIIPHQNDELKLRKFQKVLLSSINKIGDARGWLFIEVLPLWAELSCKNLSEIKSIKELGKIITKIEVKSLSWDSNFKGIVLNMEVTIGNSSQDKSKLNCQLPLASPYKKENSTAPEFLQDSLKNISLKELPSGLKIFRLGNAIKTSRNSMAISDSVWVKLKA